MSAVAELELEELAKRTRNARNRRDELKSQYTVLLVTLARRAVASGKTYAWVGERLGISDTAVRRFFQRNNLSVGPKELREVARKISWPALGEGEL